MVNLRSLKLYFRVMNKSESTSKKLSIRHHLIGLVLITVIPVVFFASGLVAYLAQQRSEALQNNLIGTTKALNAAIDEQIVSVVSSLKILSEVEDFHPDKIQYLHKRLRRFVDHQQDWSHIAFVDTRGTQIFNTASDFGKKQPRLNSEKTFRKMLATGDTVISGYQTGEDVITVSVPVKNDGMILYALVGSLKLSSFSRLLNSQQLPNNWTASIMDKDANILAHSKNENFIGKKANPKLSEKTHWEESHNFNDLTVAGKKTFGASSHSKITGWTIVLRIPDDGHLFTYWKSISFIILGGAFLLSLSIFLALYLSRTISDPIHALAKSAKALGQGSELQDLKSSYQEVEDVGEALKQASLQRGRNEEKIQMLYNKAQDAVKLRDTFLSVASHELKTPITTLKLQFQMLDRLLTKKDSIPKEDLEKPIFRVLDQLRRLTLLIDDLLDVSRINSGKMEYHSEPFDLITFVNDVVQQFEGEANKANSPMIITGPVSLTGAWDRHRLEQVVVNLITNAIKYGNAKPITITVSENDGNAVIEVRDHGVGISSANLGRIFDRYERVGDDKSISGLGLGLWIVKQILEGLGGDITVDSQLGEGSVFTVIVPRSQEDMVQLQKIVDLNLSQSKPLNV
jgi:signal transduction histidine kinase